MKFLILISICFFCSIKVICQESTMLVDSTKIWSTLQVSLYNNLSGSTVYCQFKGDSILNNRIYKKVWISYDETHSNWIKTNQLIRQQDQKVYLHSDNSERILYDFSLDVSDTFIQQNQFGSSSNWTVVHKDNVSINGKVLKRIELKFGEIELLDIWIEGIGSSFGVLNPGNLAMDFATELLCVQNENQAIYSNTKHNNCFVTLGINENQLYQDFNCRIYSNYISIETTVLDYDFKILNILGATINEGHLQGSASIPLTSLKSGIYLIYFYSENEKYQYKLIKK